MTKADIIMLIKILSANYRKWPEDGKEEDTVTLWEMMLGDLDLKTAQNAAVMHMSRSVYPPTVADIRDAAARISGPQLMDAIEAWEQITKAVKRYGYYREAEAMASMNEDVAQMTKRFGWSEICMNDNPDTLRAQFRMAWETQNKRKKEVSLFAPELAAMLEMPNLVKRLN
jgi:hypothetical protein